MTGRTVAGIVEPSVAPATPDVAEYRALSLTVDERRSRGDRPRFFGRFFRRTPFWLPGTYEDIRAPLREPETL